MSKKNVKFPEMKAAVREREHTARTVYRKAIQDKAGMDRWQAWVEKRLYGEDTRSMLLAYGMIRGLPYAACEKKCGDLNFPSPTSIAHYANTFGSRVVTFDEAEAWIALRDAPVEAAAPAPAPEAYAAIQDTPPAPPAAPEATPPPEEPKGFVEGLRRLFQRTA
jgi:hypothetical protein